MPLYEYECPYHGRFLRQERADHVFCYEEREHVTENGTYSVYCNELSKRKWSVSIKPSMQEHFNLSVGKPISSNRQFKDELKRKSEEATLRSISGHEEFRRECEAQGIDIGDAQPRQIEHNFVPIEAGDKEAAGVTDEGLDATYKQRTDSGQRERKFYSA